MTQRDLKGNTNKYVNLSCHPVVIHHTQKSLMFSEEVGGGKAGGHYCWHKKARGLWRIAGFQKGPVLKRKASKLLQPECNCEGVQHSRCSVLCQWLQVQNENELWQLWCQKHNRKLIRGVQISQSHFIPTHNQLYICPEIQSKATPPTTPWSWCHAELHKNRSKPPVTAAFVVQAQRRRDVREWTEPLLQGCIGSLPWPWCSKVDEWD